MLRFSIKRVLSIRGASDGMKYLTQNGFTRSSASNIYLYVVSNIKVKNVERLCRLLNCTPNDFFEWRNTEGEEALPESHALNALRREKSAEINNLMKEIPVEKLADVEDFLREMKKKVS